jgi:Leucine-rich repeat (LRR) protein
MALDVVEYPEDIAWLDLSFNDISSISEDVLEFPALKMIYLHGNKIKKFSDLVNLILARN